MAHDIVAKVTDWLPTATAARCRGVCRAWCDLLDDRRAVLVPEGREFPPRSMPRSVYECVVVVPHASSVPALRCALVLTVWTARRMELRLDVSALMQGASASASARAARTRTVVEAESRDVVELVSLVRSRTADDLTVRITNAADAELPEDGGALDLVLGVALAPPLPPVGLSVDVSGIGCRGLGALRTAGMLASRLPVGAAQAPPRCLSIDVGRNPRFGHRIGHPIAADHHHQHQYQHLEDALYGVLTSGARHVRLVARQTTSGPDGSGWLALTRRVRQRSAWGPHAAARPRTLDLTVDESVPADVWRALMVQSGAFPAEALRIRVCHPGNADAVPAYVRAVLSGAAATTPGLPWRLALDCPVSDATGACEAAVRTLGTHWIVDLTLVLREAAPSRRKCLKSLAWLEVLNGAPNLRHLRVVAQVPHAVPYVARFFCVRDRVAAAEAAVRLPALQSLVVRLPPLLEHGDLQPWWFVPRVVSHAWRLEVLTVELPLLAWQGGRRPVRPDQLFGPRVLVGLAIRGRWRLPALRTVRLRLLCDGDAESVGAAAACARTIARGWWGWQARLHAVYGWVVWERLDVEATAHGGGVSVPAEADDGSDGA